MNLSDPRVREARCKVIRDLMAEGITTKVMSVRLGVPYASLWRFMARNGLKTDNRPPAKPRVRRYIPSGIHSSHEAKVAKVRELAAIGLTRGQIAVRTGIGYSTVIALVIKHGIKVTTKKTRCHYSLGTEPEDWQVSDPAAHDPALLAEARRLLNCSDRHAAWVLSCPKTGNATGWNGGNSI